MHDIVGLIKHFIVLFALCTPRFIVAFTISPFISSQIVNRLTKNSIALSFSLILFPTVFQSASSETIPAFKIMFIIIKEGFIGMMLGFLIGLFFYGVEAAGQYIDYQRGASMASFIDPTSGNESSPLGSLLIQTTILLFFSSGGFLLFLSAIYESYRVWPILSVMPQFDLDFAFFFLNKMDDMTKAAVILAAPAMIALFLSEFGLGLLNRFAPQLNVFSLSMPIKSVVGIFILILYLQFFISYVADGFLIVPDIFSQLKTVIK